MGAIISNGQKLHQSDPAESPKSLQRVFPGSASGYDAQHGGVAVAAPTSPATPAPREMFGMSDSGPEDPHTLALVARIQQRDTQALGDYIELMRRPLLVFIERHMGDGLRRKVEPDDIFQELSADALRSLGQYDLADRDPFGWLCQIAERRIIDAHRRYFGAQKRAAGREVSIHGHGGSADTSRAGLVDLLVASMTSASRAVSRDEKQLKMLAALENLPVDQQEAVRLRYLEGWPSKQIAERLGKTDGAVRVMLTRALAKLQTLLDPNGTWQSRS